MVCAVPGGNTGSVAWRVPSVFLPGDPSIVTSRTPHSTREGFLTVMLYSAPRNMRRTEYSFHVRGMHGSTTSPPREGRTPSIHSRPTRKSQAADPEYQVHPPLP